MADYYVFGRGKRLLCEGQINTDDDVTYHAGREDGALFCGYRARPDAKGTLWFTTWRDEPTCRRCLAEMKRRETTGTRWNRQSSRTY